MPAWTRPIDQRMNGSFKWFADQSGLEPKDHIHLNDLCRAVWNDNSDDERASLYGVRAAKFQAVHDPRDADACLLPLKWPAYVSTGRRNLADRTIANYTAYGKPILIFSEGDSTANVPYTGISLFERSAYRTRQGYRENQTHATPAFISDYLNLYCNGGIQFRPKSDKPVVGFCGQAGGNALDFFRRALLNRTRKIAFTFGLRKWEPAPFETTHFRKRVLDTLLTDRRIDNRFLIRKRYRAGYWKSDKDPFHPTRVEFIDNILHSDYTVCMRGGGNFSVRFYETLCLGRIPVFVDTDCVLPFDESMDYRKYCVWVKQDEIPLISEKILDFHSSLHKSSFRELQEACRNLWLERLSMNGYYSHFPELFVHRDGSEWGSSVNKKDAAEVGY